MKKGWEVRPLGEVCRLINGRAYKRDELLDDGSYRVLRVGNFFTNNHWYYSDFELEADKYCDFGDLLYAWSASFGPRIWSGEKVIYHYHIWKVVPEESSVMRDFLFYFFEWDKERIKSDQGTGTTMIHVSKGSMEARTIPLPPLPEQKWIVEVLDKAFEGLAVAKANAEANFQNAKELFQGYLNEVFRNPRESWTRSNLGKTCAFEGGSQPPKSEFSKTAQRDFVRLIQIRDYKTDKHIVYVPKGKVRRFCDTSDVMIGRYGPPLFQILRGIEGAYNVALMKATPNENLLTKDFLYYFLQNGDILNYIVKSSSRAAGQIGLNKATLEPYLISFPSFQEQAELVDKFEQIREEAESLERSFAQKAENIDSLKQSLLQKAFAGELT